MTVTDSGQLWHLQCTLACLQPAYSNDTLARGLLGVYKLVCLSVCLCPYTYIIIATLLRMLESCMLYEVWLAVHCLWTAVRWWCVLTCLVVSSVRDTLIVVINRDLTDQQWKDRWMCRVWSWHVIPRHLLCTAECGEQYSSTWCTNCQRHSVTLSPTLTVMLTMMKMLQCQQPVTLLCLACPRWPHSHQLHVLCSLM